MDTAKYWDIDRFIPITPEEYVSNPALHDKPLCCPAEDCNAAVQYRKGSEITEGGDGQARKACFVTEDVQEHKDRCEFKSDRNAKYELQLEQALKQGKHILFNLNFQTSIKAELSLSVDYKRAVFNHTGAMLYPEWRKRHKLHGKNHYIPKNFTNAQSVVRAVKKIQSIGQGVGIDDPLSCISINHNGGVTPYRQFYLKGNETHTDFFNAIASSRQSVTKKDLALWNLTAALRRIEIHPAGKQKYSDSLLGKSYRTSVNGQNVWVGDTLSFRENGLLLRDQLLSQGQVVLIGNPNVNPKQLDRFTNGDSQNLNVNWIVTGEHQIYTPSR